MLILDCKLKHGVKSGSCDRFFIKHFFPFKNRDIELLFFWGGRKLPYYRWAITYEYEWTYYVLHPGQMSTESFEKLSCHINLKNSWHIVDQQKSLFEILLLKKLSFASHPRKTFEVSPDSDFKLVPILIWNYSGSWFEVSPDPDLKLVRILVWR